MADVFISYARVNQERVRKIAELLEAEGYSVWWDAELPAHRAYGEVIQEQVANAKAIVVVWSADSKVSEWVRSEADMGPRREEAGADLARRLPLPMPFNQIHVANLRNWQGSRSDPEWQLIARSISELVERAPPTGVPSADLPSIGLRRKGNNRFLTNLFWAGTGSVTTLLVCVGLWAATGMKPFWTSDTGKVEPDYVFPNSDHALLTTAEITALSDAKLRIARNEIFARHSRKFVSSDLKAYFCRQDWYTPLYASVTITPVEQSNVDAICSEENRRHAGLCPKK